MGSIEDTGGRATFLVFGNGPRQFTSVVRSTVLVGCVQVVEVVEGIKSGEVVADGEELSVLAASLLRMYFQASTKSSSSCSLLK